MVCPSTLEKAQAAAQPFSVPNIKNKGQKQLSAKASFANLLIFHQSIQFLGNQIQVNSAAQYTDDSFK